MRLLRLVPFLSCVVALWLMLGPAAAHAQEEDDFGRTGFYIGVGGTLTNAMVLEGRLEDDLSSQGLGAVDVDVKSSFGADVRGGYRFHPHFAAELEADWHSPFDAEATFGLTPYAKVKVEPLVFTTNLKAYLFKDRFQPYAVAGVGVMTAYCKTKYAPGAPPAPGWPSSKWRTGFAARFGGGVDMYITEHIVLNAEVRYVLPAGAVERFDMISLGWGLQYRF